MRISLAILLSLVASPALAGSVRHLAPAEAAPGRPLELEATVTRAWESTLTLHFRTIGAPRWEVAEFRRDDQRWISVIPAEVVQPPGVEYFIDAQQDGQVVAEFASAALPHPVAVEASTAALRLARDLAQRGGRRSRISAALDWIDFGKREVEGNPAPVRDRYYRVDIDWSYLVARYPLKAIRIGYSRLLGYTLAEPGSVAECDGSDCEAGFRVGGFFELRFALVEGVELDTRAAVMATAADVGLGGRAELRVGVEDASHVALGGEVLADVGSSGYFRLGWGTVPGLPMAMTVEATNFPRSERPTAVRLLYDVAHPFPGGLRLGARVGYQARDELVGGVTLGVRGSVDF